MIPKVRPQPFRVTTHRVAQSHTLDQRVGWLCAYGPTFFSLALLKHEMSQPQQHQNKSIQITCRRSLAQRLGDLSCCGTMFSGCLVHRGTAWRVILTVAWTQGDTRAAWCGATGRRSGSVAGVGRADILVQFDLNMPCRWATAESNSSRSHTRGPMPCERDAGLLTRATATQRSREVWQGGAVRSHR